MTPPMRHGPLSDLARHVILPSGIVSTGWPAVEKVCSEWGDEFDEWQAGLGRAILAKRADGMYAASIGGVVLSIPRQVAKTFLVMRIVMALCVLFPGLKVLWTAHHGATLTNTLRNFDRLSQKKQLLKHDVRVNMSHGKEVVKFGNGSIIIFGSRDQGFGRGFDSIDIEVFDEAQILNEKALEDMVAATNQSTHPHGALIFYMGTPPRKTDAGDVFTGKRKSALSGDDEDILYVEFSADPDADPDDREQIMKANPSVPHRTSWTAISRLRKNLPSLDSWLLEGLGIWYAEGSRAVIDSVTWDALYDELSMGTSERALAIDVNPERSAASVAGAAQRDDGLWHVELLECRQGIAWVVPYVARIVHAPGADFRCVVVDGRSPAASLIPDLVRAGVRVTVSDVRDMASACANLYDRAYEGTIRHIGQWQLNDALSAARKRPLLDGAWGWSRKEATSDITPIVAVTLALFGSETTRAKRPKKKAMSEKKKDLASTGGGRIITYD